MPDLMSAFRTSILSQGCLGTQWKDLCCSMEMLFPELGRQAQQIHAEHNGDCLFIPAEEKAAYLFWVSCARIHIVLYARASLRRASLQYGSDLKTARHTEINVSSTHRTSPDLGLPSINVISKKQMFKKEKQQKYLRDGGRCSHAADAIQGDAEELLGEREIHVTRLENRVSLKEKER